MRKCLNHNSLDLTINHGKTKCLNHDSSDYFNHSKIKYLNHDSSDYFDQMINHKDQTNHENNSSDN